MKFPVCAAIAAGLVYGLVSVGCDRGAEVLIDEVKIDVVIDSTIHRLECVPDSTVFYITTNAEWSAKVSKDGTWCHISKQGGGPGRDTIQVKVDENPTSQVRNTSIVLVSGTNERVYKISQKAGEAWFDTMYWKRTTRQRMGLRGNVKDMAVTQSKNPNKQTLYRFDESGNLTQREVTDMEHARFDTTHTYTYDDANHRLTCSVTVSGGAEVRSSRYEYDNTGMFVAYDPSGWNDPDPAAENMTGMIVPDLSSAHMVRYEGDFAYGEDRTYVFENLMLKISIVQWRMPKEGGVEPTVLRDTAMTVNYDYFKGADANNMLLPGYSSGNVTRCSYAQNGMLYKVETQKGSYEFLKNVHRMVPVKFTSRSGSNLERLATDWYVCSYNYNRDLAERQVQYKGLEFVTLEKYPQYFYDEEHHNWLDRQEDIPTRGYKEVSFQNHVTRVINYY